MLVQNREGGAASVSCRYRAMRLCAEKKSETATKRCQTKLYSHADAEFIGVLQVSHSSSLPFYTSSRERGQTARCKRCRGDVRSDQWYANALKPDIHCSRSALWGVRFPGNSKNRTMIQPKSAHFNLLLSIQTSTYIAFSL